MKVNAWFLRACLCAIAGSLLTPSSVRAQVTPVIELRGGEKVPIANRPVSGGVDPIRCDGGGNIYMRPITGKTPPLLSPILRISPDGLSSEMFDISSLKELKEASAFAVNDFAVTKSGHIYELVSYETKAGTFGCRRQL